MTETNSIFSDRTLQNDLQFSPPDLKESDSNCNDFHPLNIIVLPFISLRHLLVQSNYHEKYNF